jgi:hypothetical protein
MFDLMDNLEIRTRRKSFKNRPSSAFIDIPVLSDKYDIIASLGDAGTSLGSLYDD